MYQTDALTRLSYVSGASGGNRTLNHQFGRLTLCQLSYTCQCMLLPSPQPSSRLTQGSRRRPYGIEPPEAISCTGRTRTYNHSLNRRKLLPLSYGTISFGSRNRTDELFLAPAYETGWDYQHPSRSRRSRNRTQPRGFGILVATLEHYRL